MPDKRTTELTAIDAVSGVDLVMVVDDPSGTAVSKKATVTQVLVNTAKVNTTNTFVGDQTIDGDLVVTGEVNPLRLVAQLAKVDALEGRAVGDPSGSRTLLSRSLVAGLSMRHDESLGEGRITAGNYDTQVYQRLIVQSESLRILTGVSPVIAEHLRVHPSGGVTIGTGTDHTDPGVGALDVAGTAAFHGDVRVDDNLIVFGNQSLSGTLVVGGATTLNTTLTVGGSITEANRPVPMGYWRDVAFSAANFSGGSGMTITLASGNVSPNRYTLIGKTLHWIICVNGFTLSGPSSSVWLTLPAGLLCDIAGTIGMCTINNQMAATGWRDGMVSSGGAGTSFLAISQLPNFNWTTGGTDNNWILMNVSIPVQ